KQSLYFLSRTAIDDRGSFVKVRVYYDRFFNQLDSFDDGTFTTQNFPYAFNSTYDDYAAGGSIELYEQLLDGRDLFRAAFHVRWDQHNAQQDGNAQPFLFYSQP